MKRNYSKRNRKNKKNGDVAKIAVPLPCAERIPSIWYVVLCLCYYTNKKQIPRYAVFTMSVEQSYTDCLARRVCYSQ